MIIGGGFIGMEVTAVLAQQGVPATILFPGPRVWDRFFTPEMSAFFEDYYKQRGAIVAAGERITAFTRAADGRTIVIMASGKQLPADLIVAGIGADPVVEPLHESGAHIDHGVVTNEYLETGLPNVWAAGDVASYRDVLYDKQRRVEHWDNAVGDDASDCHHELLADRRVPEGEHTGDRSPNGHRGVDHDGHTPRNVTTAMSHGL